MRRFTSAVCAASVTALVACSMNSGSPGPSLPTGAQSTVRRDHANWMPINSAGWLADPRPLGHEVRPAHDPQRGGYYATEFRSDVGVYGYSPKPNKDDIGPVCSPSGGRYDVNGIASDVKGNLIVPGSSRPGGRSTTGWNVSVYQGSSQPMICGQLLGTIPTTSGQPVDAASLNAVYAPIAVSQIDFTTKLGEVVICTLASLSCGAPITSSAITGLGAGVAMDAAGDCWLSTAKKMSNGVPVGFRLIYWAGCTGNGVAATGTSGQSSYGGLFVDNSGNIGAFDAFSSKLHLYSGCNPNCTRIGEFALEGQSFYGNLNGSGEKLAVGDVSSGSVDVYNYRMVPSALTFRYSFSAGLRRSRIVESGIFSPSNHRLHTSYEILYSFGAAPDGNNPDASLIDVGGTLYGTTLHGGAYTCGVSGSGCGTVYRISLTGSEKVLHDFPGTYSDGTWPSAGFIDVGGTLYGTTSSGGGYSCNRGFSGCGTVYRISVTGSEKVLHDFDGSYADGTLPYAGLIDVGGTLYGTTGGGGSYGQDGYGACCGTVFSITPSGTEKVLHSFGNGTDGADPAASLIEVKGTLYGTTVSGGANVYGTVFSITTGGTEKVLYSFGNGTDGADPAASLIEVKGTLYGTTLYGGAYHVGTVFSITPSGTEKVLHSFNGTDGAHPGAGLIEVNGTLYGTTGGGGAYRGGTAFSITPGGSEKVLHSFSGTDGADPAASLIEVEGALYGTTYSGGANGDGTVFELIP